MKKIVVLLSLLFIAGVSFGQLKPEQLAQYKPGSTQVRIVADSAGFYQQVKDTFYTLDGLLHRDVIKLKDLSVIHRDTFTDIFTANQTLSIASDNLEISNGNNVSLLPYLDNTDDQTGIEVPIPSIDINGTSVTDVQNAITELNNKPVDSSLFVTNTALLDTLQAFRDTLTTGGGVSDGCKNVDTFGAVGDGITDDYQAFQDAVDAAGNNGCVNLTAGKTYKTLSSVYIDSIQHLTIKSIGGKATWIKPTGTELNTTLASDYNGELFVHVNLVPSHWKVGELIYLAKNVMNDSISNRAVITSISNDSIFFLNTLKYQGGVSPDFDAPAGTTLLKHLVFIRGRPSATEGGFGNAGSNKGTIIENIIFDGQRDSNMVALGWTANSAILLHGAGSEIKSCEFNNFPSEVILGHGLNIHDNVFQNLGGSPLHLSAHDDTFSDNSPSFFSFNTVKNSNLTHRDTSGHNEGVISLSWNGGDVNIVGNHVTATDTSFNSLVGAVHTSGGANDRGNIIVSGNYLENYNKLFYSIEANVNPILATGNILVNCGSTNFSLANSTVQVCGNTLSGGTTFANLPNESNCNGAKQWVDESGGNLSKSTSIAIGGTGMNSKLNVFNTTSSGYGTMWLYNSQAATNVTTGFFNTPSITGGQHGMITIGKSLSTKNSGVVKFKYVSSGSNSNAIGLGMYGVTDPLLVVTGSGFAGIGTTAPVNTWDIEGSAAIGTTYSGTTAAPTNGLIVEGNTYIGSITGTEKLEVTGNFKVTGFIRIGEDITINYGTGTPEGNLSAGLGSTFHNTAGGAGVSYYVKESGGTGNTGWVGK